MTTGISPEAAAQGGHTCVQTLFTPGCKSRCMSRLSRKSKKGRVRRRLQPGVQRICRKPNHECHSRETCMITNRGTEPKYCEFITCAKLFDGFEPIASKDGLVKQPRPRLGHGATFTENGYKSLKFLSSTTTCCTPVAHFEVSG